MFEKPMLPTPDRPFSPEGRSEAGLWEGDLTVAEASSRQSTRSSCAGGGAGTRAR